MFKNTKSSQKKKKKTTLNSKYRKLVNIILQELKSKSKSIFAVSVISKKLEPCLYCTSNMEYTRIKSDTSDDPSEPWDCNMCCFTDNLWVFLSGCYIPIDFPYIVHRLETAASIDISPFPKICLVRFICWSNKPVSYRLQSF